MLAILLAMFFFIWMFFQSITTRALPHLGKTLFAQHSTTFWAQPLYSMFPKDPRFEITQMACRISENTARFLCVGAVIFAVMEVPGQAWSVILYIVIALATLFICDFFPTVLAERMPIRAFLFSAPITSFFLYLSYPVALLFLKIAEPSLKTQELEEGIDPLEGMRETIMEILQDANVKGSLETIDKKLIEAVVKFKDRIVREVMVPRVDLFSLPAEKTIKGVTDQLTEMGYSRIPVYQDSIDNVIGVLMFKDILAIYSDVLEGRQEATALEHPIKKIVKPVFYAPETKRVSHLLQEFRLKQVHMAIVVDEYGGTEGVVTMEDLLEEIVGEITDEYDIDDEMLYMPDPAKKGWIVDARMSLIDAEEAFGIEIPQEGEYDTIGGYVFHTVGSIPPRGKKVRTPKFELEILKSSERNVEKVRVIPL